MTVASGGDDGSAKFITIDNKSIYILVIYEYKCHFLCEVSREQRIIIMTIENWMFDMLSARHCPM